MERFGLRSIAALSTIALAVLHAATAAGAQTWHWNWTLPMRTPHAAKISARSSVTLDAAGLHTAYTVPLQSRQVVIESCTAPARNIERATLLQARGTTYLLIRFKISHDAACVAGRRPAVALPTDDRKYVGTVVAAINRRCCTATATAAASPKPRPTAVLVAASPVPTPTPDRTAVRAVDWVENEGLFSFVRIRNLGHFAMRVIGTVFHCRDVESGCGPFHGGTQVAGDSTATVAVITSADRGVVPVFAYRYTIGDGAQATSVIASSSKAAPPNTTPMSEQELRGAQADAIAGLRLATRAPDGPTSAARLIKRGSSRLAIGQKGTALIRVTVAANGTPLDATIVSITNSRLSAAAIETAVSSTYAPAVRHGRSITAAYVATFSFDGEDPNLAAIPLWKRSPVAAPSAIAPVPATTPSSAATAAAAPTAAPTAAPLPPSAPPTASAVPSAAPS